MTQRELSVLIGKSERTVEHWFQRDVLPDAKETYAIAKVLGVSVEHLITGLSDEVLEERKEIAAAGGKIPLLRQSVSCGPGADWNDSDIVDSYIDPLCIPAVKGKKLYGFSARGTSMVGAGIQDGDLILFTPANCAEELSDGIYVFALDGRTYCKMLKFDGIANSIGIYSCNSYNIAEAELLKNIKLSAEFVDTSFHIFGKVIYWIHENRI